MDKIIIPEEMTITDYFAINIFNSLMNNAGYQVISKTSLIEEAYELASYMTKLKREFEDNK